MPSSNARADCNVVLRLISLEAKTLCAMGNVCHKHSLAPLRYLWCDTATLRQYDAKTTVGLDNAQICVLSGKDDLFLLPTKLALCLSVNPVVIAATLSHN